jgi:methylmalonyl-CoA mutase N-terminal domain/subunit
MTLAQPVNNVARGAVQGVALALAGVQAVEISCFDEAYRTPSHDSHMVSLRTQQIVQLEAGADRVADPLGGSYFVESLTDELERRILEMVSRIESMGSLKSVSESGWFRQLFQDAMTRRADAIQDESMVQVGLNAFEIPEEEDRLLRDHSESKLETSGNLIEFIADALEAQLTQGEIAGALRLGAGEAYDPLGQMEPPA